MDDLICTVRGGRVVPDVSEHFPPAVAQRLVAASLVPAEQRAAAINRAIAWARFTYPELFRDQEQLQEGRAR